MSNSNLTHTASTGNQKTWTFSCWFRISHSDGIEYLISQGTISAPEPEVVEITENEEIETAEDINDEIEELLSDEIDLDSMTKVELEALGREHGIELDRRKNKSDLIEELKEVL